MVYRHPLCPLIIHSAPLGRSRYKNMVRLSTTIFLQKMYILTHNPSAQLGFVCFFSFRINTIFAPKNYHVPPKGTISKGHVHLPTKDFQLDILAFEGGYPHCIPKQSASSASTASWGIWNLLRLVPFFFFHLRAFSWEAKHSQAMEAHGFREGFRYDDIVISYTLIGENAQTMATKWV